MDAKKNCISIYNEFSNIGPTGRTWTWRIKVNTSLPDRARLLSISSPATFIISYLSRTPSPRLSLNLDPSELQVAIISGGYGLPSVKVGYVPSACPIHCTTLVTMPCHAKMALMWFLTTVTPFLSSARALLS